MWKTFYQEMPSDNCKIVALYSDGFGASLYEIKDGLVQVGDPDFKLSDLDYPDRDWFEDAGYMYWAYLPDHFKLWGEG